jgi:predicted  nucleic acid-binding Zn-ribbon protein
MKTKKLVQELKALLSADQRAQIAQADSLEELLKKLQKKKANLREKLDGEKDEAERRELTRKLEVLEAQRAKGEKLAKELEARRDSE